ncbi:hypothetical protein EDD18DRAFT_1077919, partial [Armillaria luteobubalina]
CLVFHLHTHTITSPFIFIFECVVHGTTYPLMLVRPFGEVVGPIAQKDHDLGFYWVRTKIESDPLIVSIYSVI